MEDLEREPLLSVDGAEEKYGSKKQHGCFRGLVRRFGQAIEGAINLIPFGFAFGGTFAGNFVLFPNPHSAGANKVPAQNYVLLVSCVVLAVVVPMLRANNEKWGSKYKEIAKQKDVLERIRLILLLFKNDPERAKLEVKKLEESEDLQELMRFIREFTEGEYEQLQGSLNGARLADIIIGAVGIGLGFYVLPLLTAVTAVDISVLFIGQSLVRYVFPVIIGTQLVAMAKFNYDDQCDEIRNAELDKEKIRKVFDELELPMELSRELSTQFFESVDLLQKINRKTCILDIDTSNSQDTDASLIQSDDFNANSNH